jgi:hypothetical protein
VVRLPADNNRDLIGANISNNETAKNTVGARPTGAVVGSAVSVKLAVPAGLAAGTYLIKLYADDGTVDAAASAKITLN